ncbi:hypothetical protein HU200_026062 [Digitaria exilis]|uniref:SOSEKI DIX-like domain-containing protein n=1 Tax=Digitaria exilis TaxID=1010633 RepID=A0A835BW20_9POAL|nr:hypothetical protein HU200_026062 [Digitaria exilis]
MHQRQRGWNSEAQVQRNLRLHANASKCYQHRRGIPARTIFVEARRRQARHGASIRNMEANGHLDSPARLVSVDSPCPRPPFSCTFPCVALAPFKRHELLAARYASKERRQLPRTNLLRGGERAARGSSAKHGRGGVGQQGESRASEAAVARAAAGEEPRHGHATDKATQAEAGEGGRRVLPHPHFMEIALSCPDGLYLREARAWRACTRGRPRGRCLRECFSSFWCTTPTRRAHVFSSLLQCRSYRNGFVWHDLSDDDYIHPVVGREYVLKGTERLHPAVPTPLLDAAAASSSSSSSHETPTSSSSGRWELPHARPAAAHRKTKSSSSCGDELGEYVVFKGDEQRATDAATQTEDSGAHPRRVAKAPTSAAAQDELSSRADTASPPRTESTTSPDTLEALIKADHGGRVVAASAVGGSGRATARASSVLMHLISCGSVSVHDARASPVIPRTHHHQQRARRPPRPPASAVAEVPASYRAKIVEDKEYFSGSIIETATKRSPADDASQDMAVLRRSSSYNAESSKMDH